MPAGGRQHRGYIIPQTVTHSLVLLKMGEIITRNMLTWLELLISRYCCIWLVVYVICIEGEVVPISSVKPYRGRRETAALIFSFSTRWSQVVNITPRPLCPRENQTNMWFLSAVKRLWRKAKQSTPSGEKNLWMIGNVHMLLVYPAVADTELHFYHCIVRELVLLLL